MAEPVLIPDPAWTPCTEHPGHENHCSSGWCGACWLCHERGVTERMVQAYDAGFASAERRIRASLSPTPTQKRFRVTETWLAEVLGAAMPEAVNALATMHEHPELNELLGIDPEGIEDQAAAVLVQIREPVLKALRKRLDKPL